MANEIILRVIVLIMGLILATYGTAILLPSGLQQQEKETNAVRGAIKVFPVDVDKEFTVFFGNCRSIISGKALANGIDPINEGGMHIEGGGMPILIKFDGNSILISANITNSNGQLVGWIEDNEWKTVNPDSLSIYDRNYNSQAFEIVDRNKTPLLQVKVNGSNEVFIGGLLPIGNRSVLVSEEGGMRFNPSPNEVKEYLAPMFVYPSSEHLGELAGASLFSGEIRNSTWLLAIGFTLAVLGGILAAIAVYDPAWSFISSSVKSVFRKQ